MVLRASLRGQPLAVLVTLVGAWIVLRAATWQPPTWAADHVSLHGIALARGGDAGPHGLRAADDEGPGMSVPMPANAWSAVPVVPHWYADPALLAPQGAWYLPQALQQPQLQQAALVRPREPVAPPSGGQEPLMAAGHQLMWMAALARVAVPPEVSAYIGGQTSPAAPAPVPLSPGLAAGTPGTPNRWSADAWMLARKQSPMSLASSRPLYGGSQVGAVLRYQLAPSSGHRPIAYLRGSSALGEIRESEVAMGIGARPIPSLPLVIAGEARAFRTSSETSFRPAALAYTELPPQQLPLGMQAEAYFQGGYVGGKYKTPFVDGQIRVDRPILTLDRLGIGELRLGGGVWGGAQKGAKRLDTGPGATANIKLLGKPARVSMDYRFRIAGDADPGSGPALTVAAGF